MSYWKIAWRNIEQRALASLLTGLSMALGVAVMIAVLVVHSVSVRQFEQDAEGYHIIVGAKGGKLQLVLNTVYHLSKPIENIPYAYYKEFIDGRFADFTRVAVPFCLGDSFTTDDDSFRIVGTNPALFNKLPYGNLPDGSPKYYAFQEGGRNFRHEAFFEAVIGSVVAKRAGLSVGDRFNATHGLGGDELHQKNAFTIAGILEPTGTANDRALFVNMEGFYLLGGHELSQEQAEQRRRSMDADRVEEPSTAPRLLTKSDRVSGQGEPSESLATNNTKRQPVAENLREVTAILVWLEDDALVGPVETMINEGHIAQSVAPVQEITILLDRIIGPLHLILLVLTVLIVIVASISILVSIYNSMSERSHDIAVMRALGASRGAVMVIVLFESILLSVGGGLAGIVLGHGLIAFASPYIEARTGVTLHFFQFDAWELIIIPLLVLLASLVGLLPAIAAYRTDVAKSLGR